MNRPSRRNEVSHMWEKEVSEGKDNQQTVNSLSEADYKGFKAQVHFMPLEHNLNFPAVDIIGKISSSGKLESEQRSRRKAAPFPNEFLG